MPSHADRLLLHRGAQGVLAGATALMSALWVSVCAGAPEFIWQGMRLALSHLSRSDLFAALLVGLVLAFFVEPLMERARNLLSRPHGRRPVEHRPRNALFTVSLSLAFALASICLHDAMTTFVSDRGGEPSHDAGLAAGISLTTSWAIVPFAITIAWLTFRIPWLVVPTGIVAAASPCIAAWIFDWSMQTVIATTIPCLVILGVGYRQVLRTPRQSLFTRGAQTVACVAAIWLVAALLFDAMLLLFRLDRLVLYSAAEFWVDVRFYLGWALGLALAPAPHRRLE